MSEPYASHPAANRGQEGEEVEQTTASNQAVVENAADLKQQSKCRQLSQTLQQQQTTSTTFDDKRQDALEAAGVYHEDEYRYEQ